MADEIRRENEGWNRPGSDEPGSHEPGSHEPGGHEPGGREGSPLGTDPQDAEPLPGDPREAQEPQEPRTSHIGTPGRDDPGHHEEVSRPVHTRGREHDDQAVREDWGDGNETGDRSVVDELRDAWDRMRGKK